MWPYITALVVVMCVLTGVYVGMFLEGWSFVTSFYVITQIITTVGYGDITVQTESMKLFMTFYVIGCLIFLSFVVNKYAERMLNKNSDFFQEKVNQLQARLKPNTPRPHHSHTWLGRLGAHLHALVNVILASAGFLFWILLGTVFFATYESCSCSYGRTRVEGCIEGDQCPATGGYVKDWIDAYYMSVITLTTVGFGDHTPRSWEGRIFGIVWMIFGVITTATWVGNMAELFFESGAQGERSDDQIQFSKEVFMSMDKKKQGFVTRAEFIEFLLLKYNLVDPYDLARVNSLFNDIDVSGDGKVDIEEVDRLHGVKEPGTGLVDNVAKS